uniref:Glycosyl transferase family 1 domain-containing protein n=1 Tax=Leersia perrieri TaxID=77586 RepID=A0A0D9XM41_9ORYZ
MWRRGAHSDAAHHLPTSAGGPGASSSAAAARRRRRPGLSCRPSHLFFAIVVALFTASLLVVWQLLPIGDGDGDKAAEGQARGGGGGGGGGVMMRFSSSSVALREFHGESRLEAARSERRWWPGLAPVRLALFVGTMNINAQSLMVATLAKSLTNLGYEVEVLAFVDGKANDILENICHVNVVSPHSLKSIDWSKYNGVLVSSLEGKREPFQYLPVVWLIHEDALGQLLRNSEQHQAIPNHIEDWRTHFNACTYVVFPDSYLPLLHSTLDTGNFLVISGSPVDIWATKRYALSHTQESIRKQDGNKEDVVVLVIGSYLFFDELPWDFATIMRSSAPHIMDMAKTKNLGVHFIFFCGNDTDAYNSAFQELASHMGFPVGSVKHFSMTHDIRNLLASADIVLYGSLRQEPVFPPLLLRSMAFEIPIIVPNLTVITKYITDGIHGILFSADDPSTMVSAFTRILGEKGLLATAYSVALEGKLLSKNMLAYDCITSHVMLLESVLHYPSYAKLPSPVSNVQERTWLWDLFETKATLGNSSSEDDSRLARIIDNLVGESHESNQTTYSDSNDTSLYNYPSISDWNDLNEIDERVERPLLSWDEVYKNARKSERLKPEGNERDEGELERTGQPVCIYEIYSGEGSWPFLHRGSLYRGITLSKGGRRPRSDDVDAVTRLSVLDNPYYRDRLCEFGAMFAIANRIDTVHKLPWIGFQSWQAGGRKVSLSESAEETLEETMAGENHEDVIYYWAPMDIDQTSSFWSLCDYLNAGRCRTLFEDAFRTMYGLPEGVAALPPMPNDGGYWSTLHSWVMPTPSFLKFIMFSRMFLDSLHSLNVNSTDPDSCLLGASQPEKRHCYCRILEVLVNVWAYHSGRRMAYLNPVTGEIREQHHLDERDEMWVKFFNFTLLKSMDEDLAEEADDGMHPGDGQWLWPLTGQVFWPGIADREREEKYMKKLDKKLKNKVKLLERQKSGYKQKPLGQ